MTVVTIVGIVLALIVYMALGALGYGVLCGYDDIEEAAFWICFWPLLIIAVIFMWLFELLIKSGDKLGRKVRR